MKFYTVQHGSDFDCFLFVGLEIKFKAKREIFLLCMVNIFLESVDKVLKDPCHMNGFEQHFVDPFYAVRSVSTF